MRMLAFAALLAALAAGPAHAQGFNLSSNNDAQIQVYADQGIEWLSEAGRVVARGNAKAIRGGVTLTADSLTAHYRKGADGDEIWRIDADGNVTIQSQRETATGTKATYDLDKAIFVLRGQPAKLVTPTETLTATDAIEYWEKERMAVLRGDAIATQKERTIRSDILAARFKDGPKGELELKRADAYGAVVLTTSKEKVTGDRGEYNAESGIATVSGSVKITRDGNELNGGFAQVNLNSGVSKLFGTPPGSKEAGDGRVRGVFTPEKQQNQDGRRAMFKGAGPKSSPKSEGGAQ